MSTIYRYDMGFDLSKLPASTFSLTVSRDGVSETITVTASDILVGLGANKCMPTSSISNIYIHDPLTPNATLPMTGWSAFSFVTALQGALYTKTVAASWPTYIDCTFSNAGGITFSSHDVTTSYRVLPNNTETQWMLGHLISNGSVYNARHFASYSMKYCVAPTLEYSSKDSGLYENDDISSISLPCSGSQPIGMSRGYAQLCHDYSHVGETKQKTYGNTISTTPFGWDVLFSHCRKGYPFAQIWSDASAYLYYLREGKYKPIRMFDDLDDYFEVALKTYYYGKFTVA